MGGLDASTQGYAPYAHYGYGHHGLLYGKRSADADAYYGFGYAAVPFGSSTGLDPITQGLDAYPGIRSLCSLWIRTPRTPLWSLPGISLTGELFRLLRFYLLDTLTQIIQCRAECSRTLMDV